MQNFDQANAGSPQTDRSKQLKSKLIEFSKLEPRLNSSYLVQNWLGVGAFSVLYGASNVGKTFIAIDIAAHVASDADWWDNKVKGGVVVYVAAEGGSGVTNRFSAIRRTKPHLDGAAGLYLLPTGLDLFGPDDADALCQALPTGRAALIVVDTLARCVGGGDENSSRDMSQLTSNLDRIRARTGAHVMLVHHSGKNTDAGARGSSVIRAAADTEILVTSQKIVCKKQRDMAEPEPRYFDLRTVYLGKDEDGDDVTSATVAEGLSDQSKQKRISNRETKAL